MKTLRFAFPLLAFALLATSVPAQTTYTVTKAADTDDGVCDADCSLREAIAAANVERGPARIEFVPAMKGKTIAFAPGHGQLEIRDNLVIDGDEMDVTVDARQQDRVFYVDGPSYPGVTQTEFIGLTITGGLTSGNGGGVAAPWRTRPQLTRCTITNNRAEGDGGGVRFDGVGRITQTTLSNNEAGKRGGGAYVDSGYFLFDRNTVSGNRAAGQGGGVYVFGVELGIVTITRSMMIRNVSGDTGGGVYLYGENDGFANTPINMSRSIIVGNRADGQTNADCAGQLFIADVNLYVEQCRGFFPPTGDVTVAADETFTLVLDPLLADNGGPTPTHALLKPDGDTAQNPAVDAFDCEPGFDQRGAPVPLNGDGIGGARCDLGSFELLPPSIRPAVTVALDAPSGSIPAEGGSFPFTVTLSNTTSEVQTVETWTAAARTSGALLNPVLGPLSVTLAPGQTVSRTFTQEVPGSVPAGGYAYLAYAGTFDGLAVLDRRAVAVRKAAGRAAPGAAPVWRVLDAATGEPVTAHEPWGTTAKPLASSATPAAFALSAAYPNPFRAATELSLAVPESAPVRLAVYDVLGREVAVLLDGAVAAGRHTVRFEAAGLPSGVYLVRLEADGVAATQRLTLVR